jgi:hypothetical protein
MDADYSIELGPTAPALELPWHDPEGRLHYVELRSDPDSLDCQDLRINILRIPEARQFPALARFLIAVNSRASLWQTVKCDVWRDSAEAAENLYNAGFQQCCYVDLVLVGQAAALRPSLETHEQMARELAQLLETNTSLDATADIVVRRCYFHPDGKTDSDAGYCLTLFLSAFGKSSAEAAGCWDDAMDFAARCVLKLHPHDGCAKVPELS